MQELLPPELVANALHDAVPGGRMIGVRMVCRERGASFRFEASGAGDGRPMVRAPGELVTGGGGLQLVETPAYRWAGDERSAGIGKTV